MYIYFYIYTYTCILYVVFSFFFLIFSPLFCLCLVDSAVLCYAEAQQDFVLSFTDSDLKTQVKGSQTFDMPLLLFVTSLNSLVCKLTRETAALVSKS